MSKEFVVTVGDSNDEAYVAEALTFALRKAGVTDVTVEPVCRVSGMEVVDTFVNSHLTRPWEDKA